MLCPSPRAEDRVGARARGSAVRPARRVSGVSAGVRRSRVQATAAAATPASAAPDNSKRQGRVGPAPARVFGGRRGRPSTVRTARRGSPARDGGGRRPGVLRLGLGLGAGRLAGLPGGPYRFDGGRLRPVPPLGPQLRLGPGPVPLGAALGSPLALPDRVGPLADPVLAGRRPSPLPLVADLATRSRRAAAIPRAPRRRRARAGVPSGASPPSSSALSVVRARLMRLFTVPTSQPQTAAIRSYRSPWTARSTSTSRWIGARRAKASRKARTSSATSWAAGAHRRPLQLLVLDRHLAPSAAPDRAQEAVAQDGEQPRLQVRPGREPRLGPERQQDRVLDHVVGQRAVAGGEAAGVGAQPRQRRHHALAEAGVGRHGCPRSVRAAASRRTPGTVGAMSGSGHASPRPPAPHAPADTPRPSGVRPRSSGRGSAPR